MGGILGSLVLSMLQRLEIIGEPCWQFVEELCIDMRESRIIIIFVENKYFGYLDVDLKKSVAFKW